MSVRVETDVPLSGLTTLRLGGPARRLVTVASERELIDAVRGADAAGEGLLVLGGGSNVVVGDDGFPGTVVRIATRGIRVESDDDCSGATVAVAAGEPWDDVVGHAVDHGWAGIEALSGIPGSTGATPVQNVGAYGQEVSDSVARVRTWDRERGAVRTFASGECGFAYRDSRFRGSDRWVVLEVVFQLRHADVGVPLRYAELARRLGVESGVRAPLADVREAVLHLRRGKGMVLDAGDRVTWSAGSFFTNPLLAAVAAADLPAGAPRWPQAVGRV